MTDPVMLFRDALAATLGPLDCLPIPDGKIHRFHVPGDRAGRRNGWYVLHLDVIAWGALGSWSTGEWKSWSSRHPADQREAQLITIRIEQARCQHEAEKRQRQQVAAVEAVDLWSVAEPADSGHPYLVSKGCQPHGLRQLGAELLVPLFVARQLVNLQRIHPEGTKRFLSGGRVTGAYSPIQAQGKPLEAGQLIYICEGWATGATLHEHNGAAVACAMNAGNLFAVGDRLRLAYPDNPLVMAGDDDRKTDAKGKGNPGRTAATKAANALGCKLVFPNWSGAEPLELSDFNDLRQWREAQQ
ncbi:toprim domain-containing protein [Pseudomonas oryzae]|uniref:Putative DNA primase/helicase n=1 Tax=Pseudomonas oryzae TaxID=1392877 RepID=A0A1H1MUC1_9PSED|nr:toprim domain-containing protein [Pseudomonas oryzae]SDR90277.1 putative DNA primase/helicase [Pseudomonas oryzae]